MSKSASSSTSREAMTAADVRRAIVRIAHEIVERNHGVVGLAIVGLQRGGTWLGEEIAAQINKIEWNISLRPVSLGAISNIPFDLSGATVVLVDDVLYAGRTVRAAMEGLNNYGRPRAVQLAVLVDRGHRELPIRPDFVGKNLPTHRGDDVSATRDGVFVTPNSEDKS